MSKAWKLSSLLHSSCGIKEKFEKAFGIKRGIPAIVNTRWNSTYCQLNVIVRLEKGMLNEVLESEGKNELLLPTALYIVSRAYIVEPK